MTAAAVMSQRKALEERGVAPRFVDAHTHLRGEGQQCKADAAGQARIAAALGFVAVCEMPNTAPPITSERRVRERIALLENGSCRIGHYVWGGVTESEKQMAEMVWLASSDERVVGNKAYLGKTTGNQKMHEDESRRRLLELGSDIGGRDNLFAFHCEADALSNLALWDPTMPWTWNSAKPPAAEIASVGGIIRLAEEVNYRGRMHICHVTAPESVMLVKEARARLNISCGVTPSHLMFSTLMMGSTAATQLKVNPPVRTRESRLRLLKLLAAGEIDLIETDNAPHTDAEKRYDPADPGREIPSGIQPYSFFLGFLLELLAMGFAPEHLENLTYWNPKAVLRKVVE